jgi:transposase
MGGGISERQLRSRRNAMQIIRIGLDLAKYVFEVHGVDDHGKAVLRKTLRRDAVSGFFANLPPCQIGHLDLPRLRRADLIHSCVWSRKVD